MPDYTVQLAKELKKHKDYRETWQANIAMAYFDAHAAHVRKTGKKQMSQKDILTIANNAADYFLRLLCDEIKYPEGR